MASQSTRTLEPNLGIAAFLKSSATRVGHTVVRLPSFRRSGGPVARISDSELGQHRALPRPGTAAGESLRLVASRGHQHQQAHSEHRPPPADFTFGLELARCAPLVHPDRALKLQRKSAFTVSHTFHQKREKLLLLEGFCCPSET